MGWALGGEIQCFLHKQPGLAGAILFLFPIFTSLLALFSSSGLDRPPPSSLHPASWPRLGAAGKACVCETGVGQLGLHTPGDGELTLSLVVQGGSCSSPGTSRGSGWWPGMWPRYTTQVPTLSSDSRLEAKVGVVMKEEKG